MVRLLHHRARVNPKKIVFAEADHLDVLKAAQIAYEEGIAIPILLGNKEIIKNLKKNWNSRPMLHYRSQADDAYEKETNMPKDFGKTPKRGVYFVRCKIKMRERNYFAAMMVL